MLYVEGVALRPECPDPVVLLMCLVDFVPLKAADSVVSVCVSEDVSDRVTV